MMPTSLFDAWAVIGAPVANHLWQSTLFTVVAGLLTLLLRRNHARARHGLWLAASVKFLVPFSSLIVVGSQLGWMGPATLPPDAFSVLIEPAGPSFAPTGPGLVSPASAPATFRSASRLAPIFLLGVWLTGCTAVLLAWWVRWRRVTGAVRGGTRLVSGREVEILGRLEPCRQIGLVSSRVAIEPGLFGIFRPVLLWPAGISDRLTDKQIEAIMAHELCHARRRDNLSAVIHMIVEAIFWFHPLVWWLGARLIDERERACDEEVVRLGNEPQDYAEGILKTCEFYLRSPLPCVAGVTGSKLAKRIERIMAHSITHHLNLGRKLVLATAGIMAVAVPVLIGVVNAPRSGAQAGAAVSQTPEATLTFEVASIKAADPDARNSSLRHVPGGGLNITNGVLRQLITFAYGVSGFQLSGGPGWIGSERYDIVAKPERPEGPPDLRQATEEERTLVQERIRARLRALLADRFQLATHRETKELPVYALVLSKSGTKLQKAKEESNQHMRTDRGQITAEGSTMQMLTGALSSMLGRIVLDQTGLEGRYDFTLEFMPEAGHFQSEGKPIPPDAAAEGPGASDPSGRPSIFTAIQQQLGLKLESTRGPVEFIVIDRVERPSAN